MADEQNPHDPRWDWLYRGDPGDSGDSDAAAEDQTAMFPQGPRPDEPASDDTTNLPQAPRADAPPAEHTTMLPESPRPDASSEVPRTPSASFGGTYPKAAGPPTVSSSAQGSGAALRPAPHPSTRPVSPPPTTGPRYAEPSQRPGGRAGPPRPGGATPVSARRRRRSGVRWLRLAVALVVVWVLFLVIVPIYAWSTVSKVDAEPIGARPAGGPGTTYLLVGSDSREGLTSSQIGDLGTGAAAGQRTDTIILLHVSAGSGPNVMLSIPRDSLVAVPGHDMQKINSAYAFGGPKLLVRTVEQATGIRVDDYVEIGFTGVVDVVDAVGGITVCPKTPIHDPKAGNLRMRRGCQDVDGHLALDYSRSRAFPLGDITRALHQREVIAATGSAAASWQTVVLPWRYWQVNKAGAGSVRVGDNVGPFAFARFAWAMAHSSGPGTLRCVVPFSSLGTSTSVGSVVVWDEAKANRLFNQIKGDDTSAISCSAQ